MQTRRGVWVTAQRVPVFFTCSCAAGLRQGLWLIFPTVWMLTKPRFVSISMEEWMWCVGDFLGKVMFSSSLLHSNFLSLEQRRMIAMRIIEEGNRCAWVHAAGAVPLRRGPDVHACPPPPTHLQ